MMLVSMAEREQFRSLLAAKIQLFSLIALHSAEKNDSALQIVSQGAGPVILTMLFTLLGQDLTACLARCEVYLTLH